jgi:hypothetical protein
MGINTNQLEATAGGFYGRPTLPASGLLPGAAFPSAGGRMDVTAVSIVREIVVGTVAQLETQGGSNE